MSRKSLEGLVKQHDVTNHVKHFDPVDAISHHVVFVIFLCMMFIMALFMFITSTPGDPTAFAVIEYKPVTLHLDIANAISSTLHSIQNSEDRPLVLLTLYTFWIIVFGLINMVIYERQIEKDFKK